MSIVYSAHAGGAQFDGFTLPASLMLLYPLGYLCRMSARLCCPVKPAAGDGTCVVVEAGEPEEEEVSLRDISLASWLNMFLWQLIDFLQMATEFIAVLSGQAGVVNQVVTTGGMMATLLAEWMLGYHKLYKLDAFTVPTIVFGTLLCMGRAVFAAVMSTDTTEQYQYWVAIAGILLGWTLEAIRNVLTARQYRSKSFQANLRPDTFLFGAFLSFLPVLVVIYAALWLLSYYGIIPSAGVWEAFHVAPGQFYSSWFMGQSEWGPTWVTYLIFVVTGAIFNLACVYVTAELSATTMTIVRIGRGSLSAPIYWALTALYPWHQTDKEVKKQRIGEKFWTDGAEAFAPQWDPVWVYIAGCTICFLGVLVHLELIPVGCARPQEAEEAEEQEATAAKPLPQASFPATQRAYAVDPEYQHAAGDPSATLLRHRSSVLSKRSSVLSAGHGLM